MTDTTREQNESIPFVTKIVSHGERTAARDGPQERKCKQLIGYAEARCQRRESRTEDIERTRRAKNAYRRKQTDERRQNGNDRL